MGHTSKNWDKRAFLFAENMINYQDSEKLPSVHDVSTVRFGRRNRIEEDGRERKDLQRGCCWCHRRCW